jgi:hypothetical protein
VHRDGTAAARLSDKAAAPLVRVAAAAPPALLQRATSVEVRRGEGIVVVMRDGPRVMFGDEARAADKWRAAAGVLASKNAQGAAYVDVRMPDRPVAGGLAAQGAAPAAAVAPPENALVEPAAPVETEPGAPSTPSVGSAEAVPADPAATPQPVPPAAEPAVP